MDGQDKGRIALFQYDWVVTSQTANAVITLADAGYAVELFLFNSPPAQDYVNFDELRKSGNVEIYQLWTVAQTTSKPANANPTDDPPTLQRRFRSFLRTRFPALAGTRSLLTNTYRRWSLRRGLAKALLAPGVVDRALELMAGKQYRCLIGVEKKGLIWAGLVGRKLRIPLFYYSLELYTDDGEYWRIITGDRFAYDCLRLGERLHHHRVAATIIQDQERAQVLFRDTGLEMSTATIFYVPVSMLGGLYQQRSRYLQEALCIPYDRKIILYFGQIWERRYVLELVHAAQNFPEDWVLVMHGPTTDSTVEKIKEFDHRQKVILSLKMVPPEQIQEVIVSADVGLLFYSGETHNERLTAFASEKMALYMQCGVPFVAFDYPGFRRLADEDRCGVVIRRFEELPQAIGRILMNQDEFRRNAYLAFDNYYSFAKGFAKVLEAFERL